MNAKVEQKERSHATILSSAARLLRKNGISGARVADVMSGAGLTVGGFYAHFDSKEALIREVLRRTSAELRERMFAQLSTKPPADRVEVLLKRYLSAAHRDESEHGCPLPAVVGEIGTTAREYGAVLEEQIGELASELEKTLPEDHVVSRRHLALGLIALMYGGLSLSRALAGGAMSDEILKACRALGTFSARAPSGTKGT